MHWGCHHSYGPVAKEGWGRDWQAEGEELFKMEAEAGTVEYHVHGDFGQN